jgi:hypothetical protein
MNGTSNVLTALMPTFFAGLTKVNAEKTDLIDAVTLNQGLDMAALNQTITYHIAQAKTPYDITSQASPLDINGDTPGTGTMSIGYVKGTAFKYTGEEQHQLQLAGLVSDFYADQTAQCIRSLRNLIEKSIFDTAKVAACRAVGTGGTAPFGWNGTTVSGMETFADVMQAAEDNGTPDSDLHMVLGTTAASALRKVPNLFKANEAASDRLLRTGTIGQIEGWNVGVSGQIKGKHTVGTGASYAVNGAIAAGPYATSVTITLKTGTGTILAGDYVTFSGDTTRQYIVLSSVGGDPVTSITIAQPGPIVAIADNETVSVVGHGNSSLYFVQNLAFSRDAIHLIARQPMLPTSLGGVATGITGAVGTLIDNKILRDPRSKLVYQLCAWAEHRQITIEFGIAYGVGIPNPQNAFIVLG